MDSSKSVIADQRHRALTHTSWFVGFILEKVFGETLTNSDGKVVSVRDVGEDHVREDYKGFIPTPQDFLAEVPLHPWMQNGNGFPPSCASLYQKRATKVDLFKPNDEETDCDQD